MYNKIFRVLFLSMRNIYFKNIARQYSLKTSNLLIELAIMEETEVIDEDILVDDPLVDEEPQEPQEPQGDEKIEEKDKNVLEQKEEKTEEEEEEEEKPKKKVKPPKRKKSKKKVIKENIWRCANCDTIYTDGGDPDAVCPECNCEYGYQL